MKYFDVFFALQVLAILAICAGNTGSRYWYALAVLWFVLSGIVLLVSFQDASIDVEKGPPE